jgi:tetratricopeptide (TPR) repeat protein
MKVPPKLEWIRALGSGGAGEVALARSRSTVAGLPPGTELAVKRLRADSEERSADERALAVEARVAGSVRHPNLVELIEYGEDTDGPYLLTRFVPGPTLEQLLERGGALGDAALRRLGSGLASGLAALHASGWVHGDLTPRNVRLAEDGRAVLLDLGLAHPPGDGSAVGGTLGHSAPEVLDGESAREAADVFSLGIVLYQLATGRHPFGGVPERPSADASALIERIREARVEVASHLAPRISPLVDRLLDACLRRAPAERPTAAEVAAALGMGEASDWWCRLVGADLVASTPAPRDRFETHLLPFVGRRAELRELATVYARVVGSSTSATRVLRGPLGIGRTRLVESLVEGLRSGERPCTYLHARCTARREATPFGTPLELLERWLHLHDGRAPAQRDQRLLARYLPPRDVEVLCRALDPAGEGGLPGSFALSLARWIAGLANERPVVLHIDHLERARPATLAALRRLTEGLRDSAVLVFLTVTDDVRASEPRELAALLERVVGSAGGGESRLGPLSRGEVEDLVARLFHHGEPRLRLARVLHERSRGNPGLIEELLRTLRSRGQAELESGWWRALVSPDAIGIPRSLETAIRERHAGLEATPRRWLERAAVAGARLEPGFLALAFPPTAPREAAQVLETLADDGWLEPVGDRYRFTRTIHRDVVRRATRPDRRARLHRLVARALAEVGPDDPRVMAERAFHLREAGEHAAVLSLVVALLPALDGLASPQRLLRLARWGLEAIEASPEDYRREHLAVRRRLVEVALEASNRLGLRRVQRELLDHLSELPESDDGQRDTALLYLLHGEHAFATGDFGLARGMLRGATEFGERAGAAPIVTRSLRGRALIEAEYAAIGPARDLAARALITSSDDRQRASALLVAARIELLDDRIERAFTDVACALQVLGADDRRDAGRRALAYGLRARLWRAAGRTRRALAATRRALVLAREGEERGREAELSARLGWLLLDDGRPEQAEAQLRDARLASDEVEDQRARVLCDLWLGILLWERGVDGARTQLNGALALADEIGFSRAGAVGRSVRARIALRAGDLGAAEVDVLRAEDALREHGAELSDRLLILGTAAVVHRRLDRASRADALELELDQRVEQALGHVRDPELRRDVARCSAAMRAAAADPRSQVYPRRAIRVDG